MTDLCILDRQKEGLKGVRAGDLLEIQKGAYGLCNAPRLWWRRLRQVLVQLAFEEMRMMQCVFLHWARGSHGNKTKLMGAVTVHVDDLIMVVLLLKLRKS